MFVVPLYYTAYMKSKVTLCFLQQLQQLSYIALIQEGKMHTEVGTIQNQIKKFQSNQILTCTNQIRNKIQHIRQDCDQIQSSIKSNFVY